MEIYSVDSDMVIKGYFATGRVTYKYAVEKLIHLIDKLDFQRKFQNERFYHRLEKDIQEGCIMPAITIAFVDEVDLDKIVTTDKIKSTIEQQIDKGFILDGIQRLNTLKRIINKPEHHIDLNRFLYVNVIICPSKDNLLYRMVTLNNGQKPMTARHQIEMLASNLYDFSGFGFDVYSEKELSGKMVRGSFKKSDLINSYISFLSNTTSLDNKKIIEQKLDELVARKIIEEKLTDIDFDFTAVLELIGKFSQSEKAKDWLRNGNNLMGFVVALRRNYNLINDMSIDSFEDTIEKYESAFANINVSKIKLSRERRKLGEYYFTNLGTLNYLDSDELTLELAEQA